MASNRTILELKYLNGVHSFQMCEASNRTILELKYWR